MKVLNTKGLFLAAGISLMAFAFSPSVNASSLRQGSTGTGSDVTGTIPGQVLWGSYETRHEGSECPGTPPDEDECNVEGNGDNIVRLVNPNGFANTNLSGAKSQPVCAMIYVFDDDEEMGECCGCPLSSTQLATFSVAHNLTSNWGIQNFEGGNEGFGAIAIVAASVNTGIVAAGSLSNGQGCASTQSAACNGGCDPSNTPGYLVTQTNNLLGSITHNQSIFPEGVGLTEVSLFDDAAGDPTNLIYLQNQCGALVGNGTGGGICNCPIE
jgi:hypothetical protein